MKPRSVIKTDLFAFDHHRKKIDALGDPLAEIESYIDFAALAAQVDRIRALAGQPAGWPSAVPDPDDSANPGLEAAVQPVGRADGVPTA